MSLWLKAAIHASALYGWGLWYPQSELGRAVFQAAVWGGLCFLPWRWPKGVVGWVMAGWAAGIVVSTICSNDPCGLFSTSELVKNRETKEIFPSSVMADIGKSRRQDGLFTFIMANNMGSMVFVVPPLCITQQQVDEGLAIVEKALEIADALVQA